MKFATRGQNYWPLGTKAGALMTVLLLTSCTTMSLEDAAPKVTPQPLVQPTPGLATPARPAGEFPNLNVPSPAATEPLSDDEKRLLTEDLTDAKDRLGAGPAATDASAETLRLRRLAQTHADQKLKKIESGE